MRTTISEPLPLCKYPVSTSDVLDYVRGLTYNDFKKAMTVMKSSLKKSKCEDMEHWNEEFGSN
ncbi:hypothetical protein HN51_027892 [Arachis hypogaea]